MLAADGTKSVISTRYSTPPICFNSCFLSRKFVTVVISIGVPASLNSFIALNIFVPLASPPR